MPQSAIPNILSVLTFLPLIGAIVVMCLPRPVDLPDEHHGEHDDKHGEPKSPDDAIAGAGDPARMIVNWTALGFAGLNFLLSIALFVSFKSGYIDNASNNAMQFLENARWITFGKIDIHYRMGVDGISLLLILLTTFLMVLCVLFSFNTRTRLKEFMVFLLFLETGMLGVFCALDLVLFYFFWEAMLVPMYFLIGIFGHERRIYAAIKFFLFTFVGSILMLIAIVTVYQVTGTFDVLALSSQSAGPGLALAHVNPQALMWMFAAFSLAFMIKVPMFPFHTWLPDAHVEAPTAGSVILAGVMLKMGTYGFIRFCLPLFPQQAHDAAFVFITLSIIGIIYGSMVAAVQPDAKKLVAYSSVAHLGFVILGIFTFTRVGMMGALVQNINHGISTPMLFFLVGMLYDRRHTRKITDFGGLKKIVPMLSAMMLIATLASVAVPFFNGFAGEFPILVGSWISKSAGQWPTALAATGMILSAVYMLWWFQRLMLGPITKDENRHLPDLSRTEWAVLLPLAGVIFWFGLASPFWTQRMDNSVEVLLNGARENVNEDLPVSALLRKLDLKKPRSPRGTVRQPVTMLPDELPGRNAAARAVRPGSEGTAQ
jgi:NADH-quinone oxidoreductase subunit M